MKELVFCLLAWIGANWLVDSGYLPINQYVLYPILFFILLLIVWTIEKSKRWKKISFNDAIADELMRIRLDLTDLKIKQDKRGWDNFPDEFLKMESMYHKYPYVGICDTYEDPEGKWGKIIIDLGGKDWFEDRKDNIFYNQFDSDTLRKINSPKKIILKEGMYLTVHIHEDEIAKQYGDCIGKGAKILSIEEGEDFGDLILSLEIHLRSSLDYDHYCPSLPNEKELIEKSKIIRKVAIFNYFRHGIRLEEKKTSDIWK